MRASVAAPDAGTYNPRAAAVFFVALPLALARRSNAVSPAVLAPAKGMAATIQILLASGRD